MDFTTLAFLIFIVIALNALVLWVIFKNGNKDKSSDGILLMQKELQELRSTMDRKMGETTQSMHDSVKTQFTESQRLMRDINKEVNEQLMSVVKGVSEVSASSKEVFTVAEQLQNLEKVLKHQKQRGNLGEASLQLALENILPATSYKMQFQFKDNDVVDAVIITKDGMIPIDAKFSLDNYRRLVDETDDTQRELLEKEFCDAVEKAL